MLLLITFNNVMYDIDCEIVIFDSVMIEISLK